MKLRILYFLLGSAAGWLFTAHLYNKVTHLDFIVFGMDQSYYFGCYGATKDRPKCIVATDKFDNMITGFLNTLTSI